MKTCKHILLVEDDDDIREQMSNILLDEGYNVTATENGQVALDYLKSCSEDSLPGCIILDLMMPVMTGKQFMDISLNHDLYKSIPIVVASAKGSPKEEFIDLPDHVEKVKKPMDIDELLRVIEAHCGKP